MRHFLWLLPVAVFFFAGQVASAQDAGFVLEGVGSQPVPVSLYKMTNLVFPVAIRKGVKVSTEIFAQKVSGVENVIELKAARRGFTTTNLSVYGLDGRLYSFVLRYVEDTSVLNFRVRVGGEAVAISGDASVARVLLTGLPIDEVALAADAALLAGRKGFVHRSVRNEGMKLRLRGVWLMDSLMWLMLDLSNGSLIDYRLPGIRCFIEDRKKVNRTASQQLAVVPVYEGTPAVIGGHSSKAFAIGVRPFTIAGGKKLVLEISEPDGDGRQVILAIRSKTLLKARTVH